VSLLAVDMGSTNCKAIAFSEDGRVLCRKVFSYAAESSHSSSTEVAPERFWQALAAVTQAIAAEVKRDPVEVLAISSHGETIVPVDSRQRITRPAILNVDNRAIEEATWLAREIGKKRIFDITGLTVHSMYPLAKILWLRKNEPDAYTSSAQFLALPTYLLTRMGLPAYVDFSLASRFLAFDICNLKWSLDLLSHCELNAGQFPIAVPAGTIAGTLEARVANELGLPRSALVVVGGHDQPCAALGSGVLDTGRVSASLGTYECLVSASESPALSDASLAANLNTYCHVVPGRYVTLAYFPSGIMIEWFLHVIACSGETNPAASFDSLCAALERSGPPGPTGLCITPHLLGTCNPDFDPAATGVISGIRPTTSRSDLYKGILEGIACEFASMAELLERASGKFNDVYISGGGARSRLGLTLRSSLAARKLHLMRCPEAVCLGTAILAGTAAGKYASLAQAVEQMVQVTETIVPDAAIAHSYKAQMEQYQLLYSSLAALRRAQATCSKGERND
jgi:xylulokinase